MLDDGAVKLIVIKFVNPIDCVILPSESVFGRKCKYIAHIEETKTKDDTTHNCFFWT